MKYIEAGWKGYRDMVVPKDADEIQVRETRLAFYAGASVLFETLMLALDSGDEPTDADMQRMADLQAEIDAFGQEIDKRAFGSTEH